MVDQIVSNLDIAPYSVGILAPSFYFGFSFFVNPTNMSVSNYLSLLFARNFNFRSIIQLYVRFRLLFVKLRQYKCCRLCRSRVFTSFVKLWGGKNEIKFKKNWIWNWNWPKMIDLQRFFRYSLISFWDSYTFLLFFKKFVL